MSVSSCKWNGLNQYRTTHASSRIKGQLNPENTPRPLTALLSQAEQFSPELRRQRPCIIWKDLEEEKTIVRTDSTIAFYPFIQLQSNYQPNDPVSVRSS